MPISSKMYVWGDKAKRVPGRPGVYAFYNQAKELIYVGESANLRERFSLYLDTEFCHDPTKRETRFYRRAFTLRKEDRLKELLDEYQRKHGRLPKGNLPRQSPIGEVDSESRFYFYQGIGKPISEIASSLEDFTEKILKVPVVSLEFHQKRGDFARWIRDVLKNAQLAEAIERVGGTGEALRRGLKNCISGSSTAWCPRCGAQTGPVKTWKMAGKPNKKGERIQLTIGHYKCPECNKTFRRTNAKERIRIP